MQIVLAAFIITNIIIIKSKSEITHECDSAAQPTWFMARTSLFVYFSKHLNCTTL